MKKITDSGIIFYKIKIYIESKIKNINYNIYSMNFLRSIRNIAVVNKNPEPIEAEVNESKLEQTANNDEPESKIDTTSVPNQVLNNDESLQNEQQWQSILNINAIESKIDEPESKIDIVEEQLDEKKESTQVVENLENTNVVKETLEENLEIVKKFR